MYLRYTHVFNRQRICKSSARTHTPHGCEGVWAYMYINTYTCTCIYIYIYVSLRIVWLCSLCLFVYTHTHEYIYTHICHVYEYIHVCICVYIYIYTLSFPLPTYSPQRTKQKWMYRVAKIHRMFFPCRVFSDQEPNGSWLICGKWPTSEGIQGVLATLTKDSTYAFVRLCSFVLEFWLVRRSADNQIGPFFSFSCPNCFVLYVRVRVCSVGRCTCIKHMRAHAHAHTRALRCGVHGSELRVCVCVFTI